MRTLIASSSLTATFLAAVVAASPALAQGSPVCLKDISGMANCVFQTVAQCEAAKGMNMKAQCVPRSDAKSGLTPVGTTGQGGSAQPNPPPRRAPSR
jgi:hypothetical protein